MFVEFFIIPILCSLVLGISALRTKDIRLRNTFFALWYFLSFIGALILLSFILYTDNIVVWYIFVAGLPFIYGALHLLLFTILKIFKRFHSKHEEAYIISLVLTAFATLLLLFLR